ncbi:beta-ketoacyl-CoA thiolase [Pelagophyceae sp. CCMP2097]|nr:beta-ketoacyl-CoA thiolase [Pelagophyceae sp. CCMP2097]
MLRGARAFSARATSAARTVVVVDGVRIPFAMSSTVYNDLMAVDLARMALTGLMTKTGLDPKLVDYLLYGTVIAETKTANIAREAGMHAGLPISLPAHTVSLACVSSNVAICQGAEKIIAGQADVVIAGGCETMSDVPIKFQRPVRKAMIAASKVKKWSFGAVSKVLKGVKLGDFAPETPSIANFTTGEVMGVSSDRLAAKFGVSREDQDRFTVRSHVNAAKAHAAGLYADELVPGVAGNDLAENGIKGDSTYEKVSKLKPAFVKPHGTHTAANSSFLTDGASASLIMSEEKALALGYKPKAYLRHWTFAAVDPFEEMLLGPTYAVNKMLAASGLGLKDIDVIEMHEAFAGQVLANFAALDSDAFAQKNLGRSAKVGAVDMDRVNILGGSLALGHPFGATGSRLVTTASNRLQRDGGRFALIAACADGGIGHSCILERYPN